MPGKSGNWQITSKFSILKIQALGENGFLTLLEHAHREHLVVSGVINHSDFIDYQGFVKEINGWLCTIAQLDNYGSDDGTIIIDASGTTRLTCDGYDEIAYKILYDMNRVLNRVMPTPNLQDECLKNKEAADHILGVSRFLFVYQRTPLSALYE